LKSFSRSALIPNQNWCGIPFICCAEGY